LSIAEPLADTAATFEALDTLARGIDGPALNAALKWAACGCSIRSLASEIRDAAAHISGLVVSIKGFTHMDQAAAAEPVDVVQGLSNTVAVLRAKARAKSAAVVVETEAGLPRARGFAGELNQIWANLLDNALDAIPNSGRVEVRASRESRRLVVCITDNGAGIPAQIQKQIFDPFFTTKPMGQGVGLGLDIVRRLVCHNDGEISVESQPGRTQFRVVLPLAEIEREGETR
jgi:signal transduction histidine kinase